MSTQQDTTVPKIASLYREMMELKAKQATTQAELIRWCASALQREPRGHLNLGADREERKKIKDDKALALLHLRWLATSLENQASGTLTDQPKET